MTACSGRDPKGSWKNFAVTLTIEAEIQRLPPFSSVISICFPSQSAYRKKKGRTPSTTKFWGFVRPKSHDYLIRIQQLRKLFSEYSDSEASLGLLVSFIQSQYDQAFYAFANSDSFICPHCGHKLHIHDSFERPLTIMDIRISFTGRRVYCPACGKSHRVLPSFIIPRSEMDTESFDLVLAGVNQGQSVQKAALDAAADHSAFRSVLKAFRQTLQGAFSCLFSFSQIYETSSACPYSSSVTESLYSDIRLFKLAGKNNTVQPSPGRIRIYSAG